MGQSVVKEEENTVKSKAIFSEDFL
ncbi:hypothetical protein CCACVL1_07891 [Corchorus capsularis]|uniref:Uncharacterized protein n=1 Tax=Corchorus capsularis TaxID=210143 RepID=A0A1R3J3D6_COCAP|nr:hypothetical protein CCACVL1_07891 [Corchorus capsularis]